jgi:hypothetical protein
MESRNNEEQEDEIEEQTERIRVEDRKLRGKEETAELER